ncbi:cellulose binding domain-containing protein [Streptomyces tropicalis]|uniref:Cellulose binding domain-containing protein n=1 Tax=Streptomyces tropicalis TaxID=3034234 RepID=A0ABT6A413_9ACTN|nr:cellulose binding domain-containing protein [Streptomyces tropicalis]MDF3298550.1 cellulose binding domain-containing protein [Streptomyces tropicalis]
MPELPGPMDAAEAALRSACWDAVLAYAELCTTGEAEAQHLATQAFATGLREVRAAEAGAARGRVTPRLPALPLMLTAVRTTAASWESGGLGHRLDPALRQWLASDAAGRYTGPPLRRPLALRGLRDLPEPDAALLWLTEAEGLPLPVAARRLGLDPATVSEELSEVRTLFRDRCHRAHLDAPMDAPCRSYAGLLDAVTRSPAAETPEDLARHVTGCVECAEAAACLRPHGGGLPAALTDGVLGWGGAAYRERRRRAAEARRGVRPAGAAAPGPDDPAEGAGRATAVRNGLLAAAVLLSLLALAVSMMPFGGSAGATARDDDRRPVADPAVSASAPPSYRPRSASPSAPRATGAAPTRPRRATPAAGIPRPTATPSPTRRGATPPPVATAPPACRVQYEVADQWSDGFEAHVTVTTAAALDTWRVAWTFPDGQRVRQMWDATADQHGTGVTATAADYDGSVPAGGTLSFGFTGTREGRNPVPDDFTLNGRGCAGN